jgi:Carboxypeptidase regulatory-like domain
VAPSSGFGAQGPAQDRAVKASPDSPSCGLAWRAGPMKRLAIGLLAGALLTPAPGLAGSVPPLSGEVLGQVQNAAGVVQMGARVFLYNRYSVLVRQSLTNETGKFAFDELAPGIYSIRVLLASFLPAVRGDISVAAGSENLLKINLASMASTVELVPPSAAQGTLMSDEWKWVLRASHSTRPVLRFTPVASSSKNHAPRGSLASFSQTSGIVRVSGGDGDSASNTTAQDLGTAFALATLVNGWARVRLSGDFGYMANSGLPSAGFRTTYSRDADGDSGPEIALTVHQVDFPGLGGGALQNADQPGPVLRTVSFTTLDKTNVSDRLQLEYGGHMDSIALVNRVTYLSPFVRGTYDMGNKGIVRVAFSSGTQPTELLARPAPSPEGALSQSSDFTQDLNALSALPLISQRDGNMRLQRNHTWEAGYQAVEGSRRYEVMAYVENVADAGYTVWGTVNALPAANLLPNYDATNFVYNLGSYWRTGYGASITQSAGQHLEFTVAGGRAGALQVADTDDPQVHRTQRVWLSARASTTLPSTGTHIVASYGWTDFQALMPVHLSLTGATDQVEGFNVRVRQPLPRLHMLRFGRIEATAEVRNALGQGYLPIGCGNAVLTNSPRILRGGFDFLF